MPASWRISRWDLGYVCVCRTVQQNCSMLFLDELSMGIERDESCQLGFACLGLTCLKVA